MPLEEIGSGIGLMGPALQPKPFLGHRKRKTVEEFVDLGFEQTGKTKERKREVLNLGQYFSYYFFEKKAPRKASEVLYIIKDYCFNNLK